jgi:protein-arginine kinase activator protein McsA
MQPQQERTLMIRCQKTGRAISTGRYVDLAAFRSSPVFFSRTYCPLCHVTHEWFAQDAWVCDSGCSECDAASEQQVA